MAIFCGFRIHGGRVARIITENSNLARYIAAGRRVSGRMASWGRLGLMVALTGALVSCAPGPASSDDGVGGSGANWLAYNGDDAAWHYSTLNDITAETVTRLGLAWYWDVPSPELAASTPLAVDGVLYTATGYSKLRSFDAASGTLLWEYDPEVSGPRMRASWGIRGLAWWKGRVLVGTADGRLIAVDAKSGQPVWSTQTIPEEYSLFITGAPLVFGDKVLIGNGGADYGANRGFVTAYDAETGKKLWRFFLVPGQPGVADGEVSDPQMEMAVQSWTGEWWKHGGGGTVWNAMTYDAEFDTVYLGTGNGGPWNQKIRSPEGGDNLFLCSIVALDAKTGTYKWHYQINPGETWDYNASMDMQLATLIIDGKPRKVLMQAPKNGFFYVIDRETGKPISAEKIARVNWAEKIDLETGRPVETANARFQNGYEVVWPSAYGAHNWPAMAFNPETGLVYIPKIEMAGVFDDRGIDKANYRPRGPHMMSRGIAEPKGDVPPDAASSSLLAWNPVTQQKAWEVTFPGHFNGGTLTTAGNLVFHGRADGEFAAYDARNGKKLWRFDAQVGIVGTPISFSVKGRQYIALLAGWGGSSALPGALAGQFGWQSRTQARRVLVFALDGTAKLSPPAPVATPPLIADAGFRRDAALFKQGEELFNDACFICHGIGAVTGGGGPELRRSAIMHDKASFAQIVQGGALERNGMPQFGDFSSADLDALRHYVFARAAEAAAKGEQ